MSLPPFVHELGAAGLAGGTAATITLVCTPLIRSLAIRYGHIAKPVEDRWGKRVIARLGGVAMYAGFLSAMVCWVPLTPMLISLLIGATLVFGLGLMDDLRRMSPYTKLVGQLLISSLVVAGGIRFSLRWEWLAIPLSILWFVLIMNAFNLLDNMDGLTAGTGAIASAICALHGGLEGQWTLATLSLILTGICLSFLRYNFPPAKIFMGDSGSHLLGFVLASLALMGSWHYSTQLLSLLVVPTLVLAVPIFDTCFVTVQRMLNHQHPFVGGTDHVSHRLAILGLSDRQAVLTLYGMSAALGLLSVMTAEFTPLSTLVLWTVVLTALLLFGRYLAKVQVYRLEASEASLASVAVPTTRIQTMLLHKRRLVEVLVDFCLISSAYIVAHLLRFEGTMTPHLQQMIVKSLPFILVIKLTCFVAYGLYRGVWRYIGFADILATLKAVTVSSVVSAVVLLYVWRFAGFSRAVLVIDWMLTFLAVGGARIVERLLDEWIRASTERRIPTLIIGAGDTGERVLRFLRREAALDRRVIGFLDDDLSKLGAQIHGCAVLGTRVKLWEVLERFQVREVLIAITDPPGELLQYVQDGCQSRGVSWRVVTAGMMTAA